MENGTGARAAHLARYTLVGLSSTVVQYVIYAALFAQTGNYVLANVAAFVVSVFNSFWWNRRLVFTAQAPAAWWKVLLKNYALYFATGVVATNALSWLFIERLGISPYVSPLVIVLMLYPINYLLNKNWAHKAEE